MRCPHLADDNYCRLHGTAQYQEVCHRFTAADEHCGASYQEAFDYLTELERLTNNQQI